MEKDRFQISIFNRDKLKKLRLDFFNNEHVLLSESDYIDKLIGEKYDKLNKECKNTLIGIK